MDQRTNYKLQNSSLQQHNPVTRRAHRRSMWRRVWLPLVIFLGILIAVIAGLAKGGVGTVERWSQISTILLVSAVSLLGFLLVGILAGLVFAVDQVLRLLPPYARRAQDAIETLEKQILAGANISAKPVIEIKSFLAIVSALFGKNKSRL